MLDERMFGEADLAHDARRSEIAVRGRTRWTLFDPGPELFYVNIAQPAEIVVVDPSGRAIAKLGDFEGIDEHGTPAGLLFPASLVFSNGFVYVTNLSLDLRLFGSPTVDSQWAAEVTRFNVARIRAQIPPLREIEHDAHF